MIWPDPSTPAVVFGSAVSQEVSGGAGSQDTEQGSQTSGGTSRRLTFSFGMAAPPQQGTKVGHMVFVLGRSSMWNSPLQRTIAAYLLAWLSRTTGRVLLLHAE